MPRSLYLGSSFFLLQLAVATTWSHTIDLTVIAIAALGLSVDSFVRTVQAQPTGEACRLRLPSDR